MTGGPETICPTCNGDGLIYEADSDVQEDCPTCGGTGKVPTDDPHEP